MRMHTRTLSAASVAIPSRVHCRQYHHQKKVNNSVLFYLLRQKKRFQFGQTLEAEAMWGTTMAFFISASPGFMKGSSSNTSRPTRNIGFSLRWSTRATSSITGPLLQFTRIASWKQLNSIRQEQKLDKIENKVKPFSSWQASPCWQDGKWFCPTQGEDLSVFFFVQTNTSSVSIFKRDTLTNKV